MEVFILRFETKVYSYTADEKVIGAEVTIYSENGDKLKSIVITDETKMQELEEALEQIDSTYVTYTNLNELLSNSEETTPINATLLGGQQSDAFLLRSEKDTQTFRPKSHASTTTEYGGASTTNYGHVKLRDNLTASTYTSAEALSSYQGKILNDKITNLSTVQKYQLHSRFMLVKRNGVVQLTVEDWDGNAWLAGRSGWQKIFDIPEGYRPSTLNTNCRNIYLPNLFGYHLRVRVNVNNNEVQIWSDGADTDHNFYGTVTWITDE